MRFWLFNEKSCVKALDSFLGYLKTNLQLGKVDNLTVIGTMVVLASV